MMTMFDYLISMGYSEEEAEETLRLFEEDMETMSNELEMFEKQEEDILCCTR